MLMELMALQASLLMGKFYYRISLFNRQHIFSDWFVLSLLLRNIMENTKIKIDKKG